MAPVGGKKKKGGWGGGPTITYHCDSETEGEFINNGRWGMTSIKKIIIYIKWLIGILRIVLPPVISNVNQRSGDPQVVFNLRYKIFELVLALLIGNWPIIARN
jgi:hypothetical protein